MDRPAGVITEDFNGVADKTNFAGGFQDAMLQDDPVLPVGRSEQEPLNGLSVIGMDGGPKGLSRGFVGIGRIAEQPIQTCGVDPAMTRYIIAPGGDAVETTGFLQQVFRSLKRQIDLAPIGAVVIVRLFFFA